MAKKSRRRSRGQSRSRLKSLRIPPWLFWTLVIAFAVAVFGLMTWGLLHPQAQ